MKVYKFASSPFIIRYEIQIFLSVMAFFERERGLENFGQSWNFRDFFSIEVDPKLWLAHHKS